MQNFYVEVYLLPLKQYNKIKIYLFMEILIKHIKLKVSKLTEKSNKTYVFYITCKLSIILSY